MSNPNRDAAIEDLKWAMQLDDGEGTFTALWFHIGLWSGACNGDTEDDIEYRAGVMEVKEKLFTEECLLKC